MVSVTITAGGWILSTDAVKAILSQVAAYCNSLPDEAPVVIYCLFNSSFCCANKDGQLSAISKQKDGNFHVIGEVVVVHEVTLAAAVTNLKRILLACGQRRVLIITPGPRYRVGKKPGFLKKKNQPSGFFLVFLVFLGFWGFFYIFAQKREFRVFSVSRILLRGSRR